MRVIAGLLLIIGLVGCTHTNQSNTARQTVERTEFGSVCRFSGSGEHGSCPLAGSDMVGASCSCPSPFGQMMGTVSKN
ncbi:hypothetical protein LHL20_02930 [Alteromonas sp. McT4-15]|uniref:hypothetical protein n=1 Tax=Alteromonas sp. McT4-15 TaxID=2881256 RepID=UPI001CF7F433|nr:hypothetical protein [Alteromonas sp. McT4-15]MCB4435195.1 hypothetical protein [Alteromonas sp. McT4-15]